MRLTLPGRQQLATLGWDHTGNTILSIAPIAHDLLDHCDSSAGAEESVTMSKTAPITAFIFRLPSHQYLSQTCGHFILYTKGWIAEGRPSACNTKAY